MSDAQQELRKIDRTNWRKEYGIVAEQLATKAREAMELRVELDKAQEAIRQLRNVNELSTTRCKTLGEQALVHIEEKAKLQSENTRLAAELRQVELDAATKNGIIMTLKEHRDSMIALSGNTANG